MYLHTKKVEDWKQINFRNVDSMLSVQFIYDLYDQYNSTINWFRFKNVCLYYQDNKLWSYTPLNDWEDALDNISKQFINPKKYSNPNIIERCYWYYNRKETLLVKFLKEHSKTNLKELSNEELYDLLFNWYQITLNQIYFINLAPVELGLQRAISELSNKLGISSVDVSTLYSLDGNTAVIGEEYAFYKAMLKATDKNIDRIIKKHLEKYSYVTIGYGSKPMGSDVLYKRYEKIKDMDKEQIEKRIKEIEDYPKLIKEKKEEVLSRINNEQIAELFDLAAKLGLMRDRKKAFLGKSVEYRNKIFDEINRRFNITDDLLKHYIMDDFYNLLVLNKELDIEEVNERKQGVYISNVSMVSIGETAREAYYSEFKNDTEDKSILEKRRGICASVGVVRGRARVCLTFEESNKLEKGEILVTYGTDFDFMNAIVKSSGIITEEGGILSHASVISRELKKPCIIAFKGITKVIKDGDLIEIDAENGKVTILEENKEEKEFVSRVKGIYSLKDKVEREEVGNKAYNLVELARLGCRVPEAYFLGVSFFENILKEQNLLDDYVNYAKDLNKNINKIYEIIDNVEIKEEWFEGIFDFEKNTYAVRSSSPNEDSDNKSFAGQYITELFCSSMEFTIKSIRKCWKSLLGVHLESYKDESNNCIFGGIVLQRMIAAEYAGVFFTKNPVSNNKDCMIVECCRGVASKLVDNRVVPDRYFINQDTLEIVDKITKNDFDEKVIKELAEIGVYLEKQYCCDVDIEWAYENNTLYLIQCRPITT